MAILTNEFQTEITDEFLNSLNEEIRDQLLDAVNSIPFIQNLISFERKRAKDLERDADGKIIVDLVNPHILEDMDYFRQTALAYKKYGKYTNLRPNRNPNSAYYKWITQEKERIWYGMTRESDGEWIPGYFYFYLNYHPIIQTRVKKGTLQGDRIVDFPEVWEGNYLMFHYIDQARNGGKYNNWKGGQHCVEIAKRGAGKAHPLNSNVPTPEGFKKWDSINIGSKLFSEFGKPITVTDIQEYDNLDIYKVTLKNGSIIECSDGHLFNVYKKNRLYTKSIREIIDEHCVTDKDFLYSIPITTCVEYDYQNVSIDAYTLGIILAQSDKKFIPKQYIYNTKEIRLELLKGLLDTNGTVNKGVINFSSCNKQLIKDTHYLVRSLGYNCKVFFTGTYKLIIYTNDKLFGLKRKNGLIKQKNIDILKNQQDKSTIIDISYSHSAPAKCVTVDNPTGLYLIEDYNITHNSYSCASMAGRNFICGESQEVQKKVRSVITAFEKESLIKDGTLNKFVEVIDFCAENTQFPRQRAKDSIADMQWIMGYRDGDTNLNKGTRNEVQGVSANNDPDKARGKRANLYIYEEFGRFKKFIDTWTVNLPSVQEGSIAFGQALAIGTGGCVCAGTPVFNNNGEIINIENIDNTKGIIGFNIKDNIYSKENISYIQKPNSKECIRLTTNSLRTLECSIDHPIYSSTKCNSNGLRVFNWNNSSELKLGDNIAIIREIPIFGNIKIFDARLIGLLIGDGSYISSPRITSCDKEIQDYLIKNYNTAIYANKGLTKDNKLLLEIGIKNIRNELRQLGIYGQSKNNKRLPNDIFKASKKDVCDLIAGLFDTDGCISIKTNHKRPNTPKSAELVLTSSCKELLEQVRLLLIKLGIYSTIVYKKPRLHKMSKIKDVNGWFNLLISDKISIINFYNNIKLLVQYKQAKLYEAYNIVKNKKSLRKNDNIIYEKITNIENLGLQPIYNLTADNTHTYIANGIITHNTEGSDFAGALEIIYNPIGHHVYAIPNVYDRNSQGKQKTVFFFGAYLNRKGHYNENGVSDIVSALVEILTARYKLKYNSSDPTMLTRAIAENPITIQEAIMRRDSTIYPVSDLTDVLNKIDNDPKSLDDIWTGVLSLDKGKISYRPDLEKKPIRDFPHKDNKLEGCIEIHAMPETDSSGEVIRGRYIAGIDPYDDDVSDTLSLGSIFVLDLFTDQIVCEYTGRPYLADDFYEICRKILLFYDAECNYENNKKGLYKYFSQYNCLYLLSETLDFLKEREGNLRQNYGNKSRGTNSSAPVKAYGRKCIRNWMLKPIVTITEQDGVEIKHTQMNLELLKSRALIKELTLWNQDGNYDRHDALAMLMLLREDKLRIFGEDTPQDSLEYSDKEFLESDEFFKINFDDKYSNNSNPLNL